MLMSCLTDKSEGDRETNDLTSAVGSSADEEVIERPAITRQTSLKELASSSRKSCEAIPEESKELDGGIRSGASVTASGTDGDGELHPLQRERVYTMPALNMRRGNFADLNPRRSLVNALDVGSSQKDANSTSGTNPRFVPLTLITICNNLVEILNFFENFVPTVSSSCSCTTLR